MLSDKNIVKVSVIDIIVPFASIRNIAKLTFKIKRHLR